MKILALIKVLFYLACIYFVYYSVITKNIIGIIISIIVIYLILKKKFKGGFLGSAGTSLNGKSNYFNYKNDYYKLESIFKLLELNSNNNHIQNIDHSKQFLSIQHKFIYNLFLPIDGKIVDIPMSELYNIEPDLYSNLIPYAQSKNYNSVKSIFLELINLTLNKKIFQMLDLKSEEKLNEQFNTILSKLKFISDFLISNYDINYLSEKISILKVIIEKQKVNLEDILFLIDLYYTLLYFNPILIVNKLLLTRVNPNEFLSLSNLSLLQHLFNPETDYSYSLLGRSSIQINSQLKIKRISRELMPIFADYIIQSLKNEEIKIKNDLKSSGNLNKAIISKSLLLNEKTKYKNIISKYVSVDSLSNNLKYITYISSFTIILFGIFILSQYFIINPSIQFWNDAIEIFKFYGIITIILGIGLIIISKFIENH